MTTNLLPPPITPPAQLTRALREHGHAALSAAGLHALLGSARAARA
jgi:hypothetical protein